MIRKRLSRIFASLGLSISLTLGLVALPAVTLAALPDVSTGYGTNSDADPALTSGAIPPTVKPGEPAAFQVWARNDDTSTISQFYLAATTTGTVYSASWWKSSRQSGTCPSTSPLSCSFGQLKPGVTVYVTVVFTTPSSGASMPVNFVFSTTGLGSGGRDSDNSHGDTFEIADSVALNSDTDFAGRYVTTNAITTVQNGQTLGSGNRQSTIVYSPETGIGVTVEDGFTDGCPVATCAGETSEISVGNGAEYPNGFKVVINLHSSAIPSGVNANNLVVYHDGVAIETKCGKTTDPDCYSVKKFSWGLQVTIWLTQNGRIKFA